MTKILAFHQRLYLKSYNFEAWLRLKFWERKQIFFYRTKLENRNAILKTWKNFPIENHTLCEKIRQDLILFGFTLKMRYKNFKWIIGVCSGFKQFLIEKLINGIHRSIQGLNKQEVKRHKLKNGTALNIDFLRDLLSFDQLDFTQKEFVQY